MQRPAVRARLLILASALMLALTIVGSGIFFGHARAQDDTPVGEWSVALARTDIPVDIASSFSYVGRWRLSIAADGTFEAERMDVGTTLVTGTWTVDDDQITFSDEDGLLSCANAAAAPIIEGDLTSGTYTWVRSGNTLTLTRVDDACPGRVILLSTFAFSTFIACTTPPISVSALMGTPVAEPVPAEAVIASPVTGESTERDTLASPAPVRLDFAADIDDLLGQLTACWASREPERWLPLLSNQFREALIQSDPNFLETLTISMSAPISWERSGDITIEAPNRISAVVKSTAGAEEDFQRFVFVFEDGQWKWDG